MFRGLLLAAMFCLAVSHAAHFGNFGAHSAPHSKARPLDLLNNEVGATVDDQVRMPSFLSYTETACP
jgi:hypothetical protein